MSNRVIIVPCGKRKAIGIKKARFKYIGTFHRACLAWAQARTNDDLIFIISAKYGLLRLDDPVEDYSQRMDDVGSVSAERLARQAGEYGIPDNPIIIAGLAYLKKLDLIFPALEAPFRGLRMGPMLRSMKCSR